MSLTRDLERTVVDGRDLVAAAHRRSVHDLEQRARAERARVLGNLIVAAFRALASAAAGILRESRLQLAADILVYRTRRNSGRPLT
jgi:hypothetical protein